MRGPKSLPARSAPPMPQPAATGDRTRLWLILILALAIFLRIYALGSVPHGFTNDEAQDGLSARQAIDTGLQVFYPENNGREGLYINLSSLLVRVLGNSIWAMRLPAAVFGVLTVWIVYLLGVELFGKRIALWSALFIATSTWHLYNSRLTNRANLAPFFLSLTFYLMFQTYTRVRGSKPFLGWALIAGSTYGLGFHTYTSFRITPLLMLAVWAYYMMRARAEGWEKRFWLAALGFAGTAAVVAAPLALYFWQHPGMFSGRISQVSVWSQPKPVWIMLRNCWAVAQMFFLRGDTDWKNNIAGQRELFLPIAILFGVGFFVAVSAIRGARQDEPRTRFTFLFLLGWLAIGALPSVLTVDEVHALRASLMIPPVFLFAGVGAVRIYGWLEKQNWPPSVQRCVIICFVLVVCWEPYQTYFKDWATDQQVARAFEEWLVDESVAIRDAPLQPEKYVAIPRPVFRVPEVPQVVLFLTGTSTAADLARSKVHYIFPDPDVQVRSREFCAMVKAEHYREQVFCVSRAAPLQP